MSDIHLTTVDPPSDVDMLAGGPVLLGVLGAALMSDVYLISNAPYGPSDVLLVTAAPSGTTSTGGARRVPHHRTVPVPDVPVTIRRRHHTRLDVYALTATTITASASTTVAVTSSEIGAVHAAAHGPVHVEGRSTPAVISRHRTNTAVSTADRVQVTDNPDELLVLLLAAAAAS